MSYGKTGVRMSTKAVFNSLKLKKNFMAVTHADHGFNYHAALAAVRSSAAPHGTLWDMRSMFTDSYSGGFSGVLLSPAFLRSTGFRGLVDRPIGVGALGGVKIFSMRALRTNDSQRDTNIAKSRFAQIHKITTQPITLDSSFFIESMPAALPATVTGASILKCKNRARHLVWHLAAGLLLLAGVAAQSANANMIFELKYFNDSGQETTNFWYNESPLDTPTNTVKCYVDSTQHPTSLFNDVEWDLTMLSNYVNFIDSNLPSSNDFFEGFTMMSGFNRVDNTPQYISNGRILLGDNTRLTDNANIAPSNRYRCLGEFKWTPKRPAQNKYIFDVYSQPRLRGPPASNTLYPEEDKFLPINIIPEPKTSLLTLLLPLLIGA